MEKINTYINENARNATHLMYFEGLLETSSSLYGGRVMKGDQGNM